MVSTSSEETGMPMVEVLPFMFSHIPVKLREDLMSSTSKVIWLQVHLPHLKTHFVGSCYRPPSANSQCLDNMCEMLENVCDNNRGIFSVRPKY